MNIIALIAFVAIGGLIAFGWLIKQGIAALKDVLEYLKERKELKWM